MRYFISPVYTIGTLEEGTHIIYGVEEKSFNEIQVIQSKLRNINDMITGVGEGKLRIKDFWSTIDVITIESYDNIPEDILSSLKTSKIFEVDNINKFKYLDGIVITEEVEDYDDTESGIEITCNSMFSYLNDTRGNEYQSLDYSVYTNYQKVSIK